MTTGPKCSICILEPGLRRSIEIEVLKDRTVKEVAEEFKISHDALQRHFNHGHICKELRAELIDATLKGSNRANNLTILLKECLDISIEAAKAARQVKDFRAIGSIMQGPYKAAEILSRGSPGGGDKSGLDEMREDLKALRAGRQQPTEAANVEDTTPGQ